MSPELSSAIAAAIAAADGQPFTIREARPVAGGCIAQNLWVSDGQRRYFVKVQAAGVERIEAERDGLVALARCPDLLVPGVVATGVAGGSAYLVLEWLDLDDSTGDAGCDRLAAAIAALHSIEFPSFGWHRDNWLGATPQANAWNDDWADFFVGRRLLPQIEGVARLGFGDLQRAASAVLPAVGRGLAGYQPRSGLLHGDLWSGNVGYVGGRPALFDPAVYAGDCETDLAMAALFGGFSPRFFPAYRAVHSGDGGEGWRRRVYQLYHVLNHVNLFGASYVAQARGLIGELEHAGAARHG